MAAGAGACGALNMWWDADIDANMARTAMRPIPRGAVPPLQALAIGALLSIVSVAALAHAGQLARRGAARAHHCDLYPALHDGSEAPDAAQYRDRRRGGGLAAGDRMGGGDRPSRSGRLALFLFIFLWTPPHFWALALCRSGDYERVGVPMLPNVVGPVETCRQIVIYTLLLVASSFGPLVIPGVGPSMERSPLYATPSCCGGFSLSIGCATARSLPRRKAAMALFGYYDSLHVSAFATLLAQVMIR